MLKRSVLILMLSLLLGCSQNGDVHDTRFMMGTLVEFTIAGVDQSTAELALADAAREMQRIDSLFTIYGDEKNPVKIFNAAPVGQSIQLPDEIAKLVDLSLAIQEQSNATFDPFLAELNTLWGFSSGDFRTSPPSQQEIINEIPPRVCVVKSATGWHRLD